MLFTWTVVHYITCTNHTEIQQTHLYLKPETARRNELPGKPLPGRFMVLAGFHISTGKSDCWACMRTTYRVIEDFISGVENANCY
jgi:hypothetical protein